jgi:hypothetical protein
MRLGFATLVGTRVSRLFSCDQDVGNDKGFKPGAVFPVSEGSLPPFASGILGEVGYLGLSKGSKVLKDCLDTLIPNSFPVYFVSLW